MSARLLERQHESAAGLSERQNCNPNDRA
jgi:hypothetical protein